jgi:ribose transport system permease protein
MNQHIRQSLSRFVGSHGYELSLLGIMIVWIAVMSILSRDFLAVRNIATAARGMTENCIVAVGMTFVMVSGGIDLSVGAVMALSPCVVGLLFGAGWPFFAALLVGLLLGILVGVINAAAIVRAHIQPIIITLATMTAVRSVVYGVTLGKSVSTFPPFFGNLGISTLYGVPVSVVITFVFILIGSIMLRRTIIGRFIYAVGGNEQAAVASGVNAGAIKWFVYLNCALFASIAGILFASRLSNATPDAGTSTPLDVISAVLLGGTSIVGGQGRILGTVMGVILMGSMVNGFNLIGISSYWQTIFIGCVLIAVVGFDSRRQARFA